nr:PTS fructose-like transporter subunit IIB [Caldisalinibacter kiritimatiensis]
MTKIKVVAVTACPTGLAQTYLAAEALEIAAKRVGIQIKVETQGKIGIENQLSQENIKNADLVILTKDKDIINKERFKDKEVFKVSVVDIIKKSDSILNSIKDYLKGEKKVLTL